MFATIVMTLLFISFMFLVTMFIIYFDYMLSIARLSSCSSISSYSARSKVHEVSDRYCVNLVLIRSLPVVGIS
jgi:low temperature requirement protein LtrA